MNESEGTGRMETTDAPDGIFVADGTWFAVGPDDHTKDSTDHPQDAMFPVDSCADVEDAWNLRNHAEDLTIEQSTLNARIKRAGRAQDCSGMPWQDSVADPTMDDIAVSAERYSISGRCVDCGDGDDTTDSHMQFEIDTSDLTADAVLAKVADEHDGVSERLSEMRQYEDAADAAQDAADVLDVDDVASLADEVRTLQEDREDLQERVDDLLEPKIDEAAEFIADRTERYEDAEAVKEDHDGLEDLRDTKEMLEGVDPETDEQTANPSNDGDSTTIQNGYVKSPW